MCRFAINAAVVLLLAVSYPVHGQKESYPNKPVRFLVGFAPGGFTDVMARALAGKLTENWGQQVVVDNRPGASTTIATDLAAKAPPDGYTLLMMTDNHVTNPSLFRRLPYDTEKDFEPITLAALAPFLLVVHPTVPANSVKELIAVAKSRPGKLNYGSGGIGAPGHLSGELFNKLAGVNMAHIPYKGAAPAIADLLGGQIQVYFGNLPVTIPHAKAGRVRSLAVTSARRAAIAPELPTVAEAGVPGFELTPWYGVVTRACPRLAPPSRPSPALQGKESGFGAQGKECLDRVAKLNREIVGILKTAEMRERITKAGAEPSGMTTAEFAKFLKSEAAKWGKLVRDSGAKAE